MTQLPNPHHKSLRERIVHALLFEVIAVALCSPLFAWFTGHAVLDMGLLNMAISLMALVWNMVVTRVQDGLLAAYMLDKTWRIRIAHALALEGGLAVGSITLATWWLNISLWQAFVLDMGILLFFMPYTVVYNWLYDRLRHHFVGHPHTPTANL